MRIKAKLIETKELKAAAIHVEAANGSVVISGFVETESQRQLATSVAQQVPNVKQVNNQNERPRPKGRGIRAVRCGKLEKCKLPIFV